MLFLLVALLLIIGVLIFKASSGEPKSENQKKFKENNPEAWARGNRNTRIIGILFSIAGIVVAIICFAVYDSSEVIAGLIITAIAYGTIWFMAVGRFKLGETKYVQNMVSEQAQKEAVKFDQQLEAVKHGRTITEVTTPKETKKDASVVKRAVVGAAVAGEVGAIVGAASAINENIKNNKE